MAARTGTGRPLIPDWRNPVPHTLKTRRGNDRARDDIAQVRHRAEKIIDDVRDRGDVAIRDYSTQFDDWSPERFRLSTADIDRIVSEVARQVLDDIRFVQEQVRTFALHQLDSLREFEVETLPGVRLGQKHIPVQAAGAYVPGGRYPLTASAHMTIVTAKAAGVPRVAANNPDQGLFRLATFRLTDDNTLLLDSEKTIIEVPNEWFTCCHYSGDIEFLPDGTLLLSTGDDTSPRLEGWNPRDKRPGMHAYDADRTANNPADRRGKLLRMMPDGSVPDGSQRGIAPNPHVGDERYDPYVYAMGFRNPYRIAVDPATGYTFVGNVGPDAAAADPNRGPRGYDEIETVPPGGGTHHGWPRCIADNKSYRDYDYATGQGGILLSCEGMAPATVYYPYGASQRWPELGDVGGRTAMAGVVYRYRGDGKYRLPGSYRGTFFFLEWSRDLTATLPVTGTGRLDTTSLALATTEMFHPIDADIGPDGAIYLAEYGRGFYFNSDSRISRIVPAAKATSATPSGGTSEPSLLGTVGAPLALGVFGVLLLTRRRLARTV
ncbi:MAG: hypothetical protein GEU97_08425 [Actinophytocola sp.]|nr:hypothetical protein [Actinophytocola sp.]